MPSSASSAEELPAAVWISTLPIPSQRSKGTPQNASAAKNTWVGIFAITLYAAKGVRLENGASKVRPSDYVKAIRELWRIRRRYFTGS